MRIFIDDDAAPGEWSVTYKKTRTAELDPSRVKLAAILTAITQELLTQEVMGRPDTTAEAGPRLALPGRDFTTK